MKTLKAALLTLATAVISMAAFSQAKTIKITKPISPEDLAHVKAILDTYDPNSYTFTIATTDNKMYANKGKGLESVSQITGTYSPSSKNQTHDSQAVATGTIVWTLHLPNLDKLIAILSKYQ
jgi:hypothetical protein